MRYGNKEGYGEDLIENEIEKESIIKENKDVEMYIKKYIDDREIL